MKISLQENVLGNSASRGQEGGGPYSKGPVGGFESITSPIIFADVILGIVNIALLLALIYVYWKSYSKFKSKFTTGLLVFAFLLLLQNVLFTSFLISNSGFRGPGMGVPIFTLNITELVALATLLLISWE